MSPPVATGDAGEAALTVGQRYVGPPESGNGGYSCGIFARLVNGPAEVTLRRPVPLERPLVGRPGSDAVVAVSDDEGMIAEVRPIGPLSGIEPPVRPTPDAARRYAEESPYLGPDHPFPGCFVCGPEHTEGLHIHVGPVEADADVCAAPFDPHASLPTVGGALDPAIVWAALDCPSYTARRINAGQPHLLARLSAELIEPVPCDRQSVVVGWGLSSEGRKVHSASALLSPEGDLLARARALWIAVEPA